MPGEKGFRYVYAPTHIETLLKKVQDLGRPDSLTLPYIKSTWLLKNNQYSAVLVLLRDMEFIDANGKPTGLYTQYQNATKAKGVLAEGIKKAYPQLFKAYPSAHKLMKKELEGYFKEQTGKTGSVLDKMISTFNTLCGLAAFIGQEVQIEEISTRKAEKEPREEKIIPGVSLEPNIQLNIGINISPDTPEDKIEIIFKNMKKYLLTKPDEKAGE